MNPSQLTNENLPAVAHAATHIPNFLWYQPAPADVVEEVHFEHPKAKDVVLPTVLTTVTTETSVLRKFADAPVVQNLGPQSESGFSIPIQERLDTTSMRPIAMKREPEPVNIPLEKVSRETVIDIPVQKWNFGASRAINDLEEQERARRISAGVNPVLLGTWRQLIFPYIRNRNYQQSSPLRQLRQEAPKKIFEKPEFVYNPLFERSVPLESEADWNQEKWGLKRRTPADIINLEENERSYRIMRGVNPILMGKFHRFIFPYIKARNVSRMDIAKDVAIEVVFEATFLAESAAEGAARTASKLAGPAASLAEAALEGASNLAVGLGRAALATGIIAENLAEAAVETVKEGVLEVAESLAQKPAPVVLERRLNWSAYGTGEPISFRWPRLVPQYIRELEELERQYRMMKGINAVVSGKFNRFIFPYIRGRHNLLPSLANKAVLAAENLAENALGLAREVVDAVTPAPTIASFGRSPASIGLGYGEKVDLTFPRRVPYKFIQLEEEERTRRMREGVDAVLLAKFRRQVLRDILAFSWTPSARAPVAAVKEAAHGISGFFGNVVGFTKEMVHDVAEIAKDRLGMVEPGSIAYVTKEEEKERIRRMNAKTDPMMEARKRRVEDELLHSVKPAC